MIYVPTRESAQHLYERYKDMPGNPMYRGEGGKEYFMQMLFDSILIVEYPFGLVRFSDYVPLESIQVHALFHSKEVFKNVASLISLAIGVLTVLNVQRIEAHIPAEKKALKRLLRRIGFTFVKTLREGDNSGTITEVWNIRRRAYESR